MGQVSLRVLHAPKDGNSSEQYEDAFATSALDDDHPAFTIAIADGASSAVFARNWANLLVTAFAANDSFPEEDTDFFALIATLGKEWRDEVAGKATSWYAQEKLPSGSSATLLVVTWDREQHTWQARSVGDACIFVVRNERLKFAFPITKSARFGDRPDLLGTELASGAPAPKLVRWGTAYEPGDRFFLMTDAVAAWFLAEFEAKRKPWDGLPNSDATLAAWLKARRDDGSLKNDDVTIVEAAL